MCGIVGIVRNDKAEVDHDLVARMCSAIRHRGPDDDGFYFKASVGLGMRRLSIIDVKGGQQPIHNQDRTAWIVFNGEIYNYLELRAQLEKLGISIRSFRERLRRKGGYRGRSQHGSSPRLRKGLFS